MTHEMCRRCNALPAPVLCQTCVDELDEGSRLSVLHRTGQQRRRGRHPELLERLK